MEANPVAEAEIVEKAARGDTHAFRLLVEKYQKFAFNLAIRFTGDRSDAEDILQEVFVSVWKNLPAYRTEVKFTTWLYKITTNRCLDFLKSRQKQQARVTDSWDHHAQVTDTRSADRVLEGSEFVSLVAKMSDTLTPKQRAVFILRDLEELPVQEVSDILSMSAGNVKSNLYYARIRMGELIKKYYGDYKKQDLWNV